MALSKLGVSNIIKERKLPALMYLHPHQFIHLSPIPCVAVIVPSDEKFK